MMANRCLKITVVGDGNVGKTCLLVSFKEKQFRQNYIPTIFDNFDAEIKVGDTSYTAILWDTAGQEEYDRLRPISYPGTDVFVVCYAVDCRQSFDNIVHRWIPELKHYEEKVPFILVGTKIDKRALETQNDLQIAEKEGSRLSRRIGAQKFIECSALTGLGVPDVFQEAVRAALSPSFLRSNWKCYLL